MTEEQQTIAELQAKIESMEQVFVDIRAQAKALHDKTGPLGAGRRLERIFQMTTPFALEKRGLKPKPVAPEIIPMKDD